MRFNLSYIDPGTGSMLFTIIVGVLGAAFFAFRKVFSKLLFLLKNGKKSSAKADGRFDCVIFSDSKRYWNIFEPICNEYEKRGASLVYMTASHDDPALEKNYNNVQCIFIGEGNKAFVTLNMLDAKILLSTTPGLDVYQWKRSKNVQYYIHIPHAISDITLYRMFGIDYYDAIILSGDYQINQIRQLESLRNLPPKELVVLGQPYMDLIKKRVDSMHHEENETTTVLLAPSWGKSSIFNVFGERIISSLISTGYRIIIRPHPQSFTSEKEMIDKLKQKYPENDMLEWNCDNDNFISLCRSSILISDFSGVIFDFALCFDKPIIYADTLFDASPYDACWIEDELWVFKTLPEIGMKLDEQNVNEIKGMIDTCLNSSDYKKGRDKARKETWANIGNSVPLIVDYLMDKSQTIDTNT